MTQPETCGQGLAERSVLPATTAALASAMADLLEKHQQSLDPTDRHATAEHDAYTAVASALRNAAAQLQAAADLMTGSRDLPMARHDEAALTSPAHQQAFVTFIEREEELSVLLNSLLDQDRAMLGVAGDQN